MLGQRLSARALGSTDRERKSRCDKGNSFDSAEHI
jgi:hypothetical protein